MAGRFVGYLAKINLMATLLYNAPAGEKGAGQMPKIDLGPNEDFDDCETIEVIHAAMFYPQASERKKHQQLAYWFKSLDLIFTAKMYDDGERYNTSHDILVMERRRNIEQLGGDISLLSRRGFIAAHWLRYRLYAAHNARALRSNERWKLFATKSLLHEGPASLWAKHDNSLNYARQQYAPVAHFWLAYVDATCNHQDIVADPVVISTKAFEDFWYSDEYNQFMGWLLARAQAYFHAALEAGLYHDKRSTLRLNDVWTLPDAIVPSALPLIDTPDLWGADFNPNSLIEGYKPLREQGDGW